MKTITVKCPDAIYAELDEFVRQGWARDIGETVVEALRRFLESHRPDLTRARVLADVEWGLRGED